MRCITDKYVTNNKVLQFSNNFPVFFLLCKLEGIQGYLSHVVRPNLSHAHMKRPCLGIGPGSRGICILRSLSQGCPGCHGFKPLPGRLRSPDMKIFEKQRYTRCMPQTRKQTPAVCICTGDTKQHLPHDANQRCLNICQLVVTAQSLQSWGSE